MTRPKSLGNLDALIRKVGVLDQDSIEFDLAVDMKLPPDALVLITKEIKVTEIDTDPVSFLLDRARMTQAFDENSRAPTRTLVPMKLTDIDDLDNGVISKKLSDSIVKYCKEAREITCEPVITKTHARDLYRAGKTMPDGRERWKEFEKDDDDKMLDFMQRLGTRRPPGIEFLAFGDFDDKTINKLLDAHAHWRIYKHKQDLKEAK